LKSGSFFRFFISIDIKLFVPKLELIYKWFMFYLFFIFHDFASSQEWSLGMFLLYLWHLTRHFLAVSASHLTAIGSLPSILASSIHCISLYPSFFPFSSDKCTSILVICDWNRFSFSVMGCKIVLLIFVTRDRFVCIELNFHLF
jgi:hypothetical protein